MSNISIFPPLGWVSTLLGAVFCGVALWHGLEDGTVDTSANGVGSPNQPQKTSLPMLETADVNQALSIFAERPLLAEGRKPASPAARVDRPEELSDPLSASVEEVAGDPPRITMLGSLKRGDRWRVLVYDLSSGEQAWYNTDDLISGWSIVEIKPDTATLRLNGAEITLHMFQNTLP